MLKPILFLIAICLVLPRPTLAAYNEAFGENGAPRPAFRAFDARYGADVLNPSPTLNKFLLNRPLGDGQKAWPVPLVLGDAEYEWIRRGVAQRARVYKEFFYDVVMGEGRIFDHLGVEFYIFVEEIFRRSGIHIDYLRSIYRGQPRSAIRFMYGPDLIRTSSGWRVLEDNIGSAPGGLGDVDQLRDRYCRVADLHLNHSSLIGDILTSYHDYGGPIGLKMDVRAIIEPSAFALEAGDKESDRIADTFTECKVAVTRARMNEITERDLLGTQQTILLQDSRGLPSYLFRSLVEAIKKGGVDPFITPGTDALSDKALLHWIDELARFYFDEPLALRSPRTINLYNPADVREARRILGKDLVIKRARSAAGEGVWFLRDFNRDQYRVLVTMIYEESFTSTVRNGLPMPFYVAQPYEESSMLPMSSAPGATEAHVDIRPITWVGPEHITTPNYPFGRGFTRFGNGRHNMHQGAVQVLVLTPCEHGLTRAPRRTG